MSSHFQCWMKPTLWNFVSLYWSCQTFIELERLKSGVVNLSQCPFWAKFNLQVLWNVLQNLFANFWVFFFAVDPTGHCYWRLYWPCIYDNWTNYLTVRWVMQVLTPKVLQAYFIIFQKKKNWKPPSLLCHHQGVSRISVLWNDSL